MSRYSILFIAYLLVLSISRPVPDSVVNTVDVTSISKGHPATYTFSVNIAVAVNYDCSFNVHFPPEFSGFSNPLSCHVSLSGGSHTQSACTISGPPSGPHVVNIPSSAVPVGTHVITLSEVINPMDFPSTSNINVTLALQGGSVQQIVDIEGVPLLPSPIPILDLSIWMPRRFRPDRIRDITFTVHSQRNRFGRKHVHMRLASGLAITSNSVTVTDHQGAVQLYNGQLTPDSRSIYLYNVTEAFSPNFPLNFTIKGGVTFEDDWQRMLGCRLDIILADYPRTLETATNNDFIRVRPLRINPSVSPDPVVNGSVNTFALTWNSPMAIDSFFDIFIEVSQDSQLIQECQPVTGVSRSAECPINGTVYHLSDIGSIANNDPVSVNLFIKAPSQRRINITLNIEIKITIKFRRTGETVATGTTSVGVLERSMNVLRSLTFKPQNVANLGETALLHFFFRFVIALPGTNARTDGRIVIEITPQLPKPDLYLRKILKCLFFRLHDATECYWDNSDSSKSVITMRTPANFENKEVDIEINTFDPIINKYYGVPLYPVNETYYYKVYTFHNNQSIPSDIYQDEFQPRPIRLRTLQADISNLNANDHAGVVFTVGIPDQNILAGRDYFIRVVFDNRRDGFADFLGFGGPGKAIKYPCWCLREQRVKQPSCVLYTSHAGNANNEIHIYGNFTFGSNMTMLLPKILLGDYNSSRSNRARIRVSVAENMPGILDNYPNPVDLHVRSVNLGLIKPSVSLTPSSGDLLFNVNTSIPQLSSVQATVTVNNIGTNQFNHLFLHFGSLEILENGEDSSANEFDVVYFTKFNLVWILKKLNNPSLTSLSFSIPNPIWHNGPWQGPFRLFLNRYFGDTGTAIHSADATFDSFFDIIVDSAENDQKMYANYHHFVNVTGTLSVPLHQGSSIVIDLTGFHISDDSLPYCIPFVQGGGLFEPADIHGIKCLRKSSTQLLVTNYKPIALRGINITITITIKIKLRVSSGTGTLTTFHNSDGTNQIEKSRPKPFNFTLLTGILLQNFLMLSEFGPEDPNTHQDLFRFNLIPAGVNITTVKVTFPQNTTIPSGTHSCYINGKPVFCSVNTTGQLSVIFVSQIALQGLTEFQFSPNGQTFNGTAAEYGLEPGYHEIVFELYDHTANLRETQHNMIFLRPAEAKEFTARAFVKNINFEETLWRFRFKLGVPIRDWDDDELPYRIYFEFPTGDGAFSSGIGLGKNTFDELPCFMKKNGVPVYDIKCTVIASNSPGVPALLSISNFSEILSNDDIQVWVTGIHHPVTMTSYPPVGIIVTKLKNNDSLLETLVLSKVIRSRLQLRDIATATNTISKPVVPIILTSTGPFNPTNTLDGCVTVPGSGFNSRTFVIFKAPEHVGLNRFSVINCPNGNCFLLSDLKTILLDINTNVTGNTEFNISISGYSATPHLYWKTLVMTTFISHRRIVENIYNEFYDKAKLSTLVGTHAVELKGVDYEAFGFRFTRGQVGQKSTISWLSHRGVPVGGSIHIKFSPNVNLYNACYSANHLDFDASQLDGAHGTPFIGCQVVGSSLVITPRDAASGMATGKRVHAPFFMDTPNAPSFTVDVTSFLSENPNLATENPIEQGQVTINQRGTRGLSTSAAVEIMENVIIHPGARSAFEFNFIANQAFPAGSSLEITFPASGLTDIPSAFNLRRNANWQSLVTHVDSGTIIPSRVSVSRWKINITITITININWKVHVVVDTHNDGLETNSGLIWPPKPDIYLLEILGKNGGGTTILKKNSVVKVSPPGQGTFQISNKGSLSSQLVIESKMNLTKIANETTKSIVYNFYGKGNNAAGTRALLRDLHVESSSKSAIIDGGCILLPGQHKNNKLSVSCPLGNNIADIDDEVLVMFSLPNDIFIADVDLILSTEIQIENNNGTILYYHYSPDRVFLQPIPAYENMSHFSLAPLTIQHQATLQLDVPCPQGMNKADIITVLAGFGYRNNLGVSPSFGCSPNCEVSLIDKNIIIRATGRINFGTRISVTGIRNPNYVKPIEESQIVCSYDKNPFLFQAFKHTPGISEQFFTLLPGSHYLLTPAIIPNFRKNINALSLTLEGRFRNSGTFLFQFKDQLSIYKVECYAGMGTEVIVFDCHFEEPTNTLIVNTKKYDDNVIRKLHVISLISIIGISRRRIYTIGPKVLIFNRYQPPLTQPLNQFFGIQYINTFDNSAIEVETRREQNFMESLKIDKYNHFGVNKKPTNRDPSCCYWYRFQVFVANANLPARMDLKANLLSEQIKILLPNAIYLHPKNDLCFVNNRIMDCNITEVATGIEIVINDVRANQVVNDALDFQVGFYIGPTGVIDGFYMLNQDLLRVALEVFPRNVPTLHSNYLSDILVIKPKLLRKFKIQNVVNIVTGQVNAITFRVNNRGYLSSTDKPRFIVEFQVGRNDTHFFEENLGSYSDGGSVPCSAVSNMEVIGQLHCYFIGGNSYGKFGINARIYVEGFSVPEPSRDVLFRIAGFTNPSAPCSPTFAISLFKLNNNSNFELIAYNELYGALNIVDNPNLVLRTNPNNNLIDIVGSFFNRRTKYRITVTHELNEDAWILLEIPGNIGFCQFTEEDSMIGTVDGVTKRFLQVRGRQHRRGDRYSFRSFVCAQPGDIIKAYIYQSDQLTGEVIFMEFPNDIDLLALRNRVPVVNDNDVRASMNVNQRPNQVFGVVTISMSFSGNFLRDQSGFLLPQYGMLARIQIDPDMFEEITSICYVQNGFSSSQPTTVVLCSVTQTGEVVVRGWDSVILFNNTNPDSIQIVFIAKLKQPSYYNRNLRKQVTLQFFADQGAFNGSFPYFNLYVPLRPITYTTNRILSEEEGALPSSEEKGLLPKDSSRQLSDEIYRCNNLANNVTYTIIGRTNRQVVEIRVEVQNIRRRIGLRRNMAIFMKNWQYSIFRQTWDQIRAYPCLCNIQTDCYYYPPKSLNNDSPFNEAALVIDFRAVVRRGDDLSCYFPALREDLNNVEMDAVILTDNFIAYDEQGEIRNLGGCQQILANNFIQGNQLNFNLNVDANVINWLTLTLTATLSQFFTNDYVLIDFGSRFLFRWVNTNLLCASFDNCRVYQTGTLIVVGNPKTNSSTITVRGARYIGWVDDGTPDTINATVFTGGGDFRGTASANLPNMDLPPLPAILCLERPAAYIYENVLFTLMFRTGDYQIRSWWGGNFVVQNLTFLQFNNPLQCAASSDMGGPFNFWICQIFGDTVRIRNFWRRTVPANTTFTIQFRGKLIAPPLTTLGLRVTLVRIPGNNGYTRVINTHLNVTAKINTTVVVPQEEIHAKNIALLPVLHENYPRMSGPLKIRFKAGADLANKVKISSFNIPGRFPLCWVNEYNLDQGERLLPDYPFDSFYNFCSLTDNNSSVLVEFPFKPNTDYEIVFTMTNGSKINNLFHLTQLDNVDWDLAFPSSSVNFTLYNTTARVNSYIQKTQPENHLDFRVNRIEVSSRVFNQPKTLWLEVRVNKYVPAYPRGIIDINLPASSFNGMFNGFGANMYNPLPQIGDEIPCDVMKNNLDFGENRGHERPICVFHRTHGNPQFPVTITIKILSSLSRGETLNVILYGIKGPNTRSGVASLQMFFVGYPFETNSIVYKRPIDHLFQMSNRANQVIASAVFTVPTPNLFLQQTGVNAVLNLDVSSVPSQPLTSPISSRFIEFKLPEFLRKVDHNIHNGTVTLNGQAPTTINRDHHNGIIFMIFDPPVVITGAMSFAFGDLEHDIFPCLSCGDGYLIISDGSNARLVTSVQYPYQLLALPASTGFFPGSATISNFNNANQLLTLDISFANAHPRTEIVLIKIPDTILAFVDCKVIFASSFNLLYHNCATYQSGSNSVLQLNVTHTPALAKYKIQIDLAGAVPSTLNFLVEEYLTGIMFQTGTLPVTVTNSFSIVGASSFEYKSGSCCSTGNTVGGNLRLPHKSTPRSDTNRFWFKANWPNNFGNSFTQLKVNFLEADAPSAVFSSSQFICAFLDPDSDNDGISDMIFPSVCSYDSVTNTFTIGAPQTSTIVPHTISWKNTIIYIECFLTGTSCFSGLQENTPIRITTNGRDTISYYSEVSLDFKRISFNSFSNNGGDTDYFNFEIRQFGEYGQYKGHLYDKLFVEISFDNQVFTPYASLTKQGHILKAGHALSVGIDNDCDDIVPAVYPGLNPKADHCIIYPEEMFTRTRNFKIKDLLAKRPLVGLQNILYAKIIGFFKHQILPNVVAHKTFYFQQSLTASSPSTLPLTVTKNNFIVDNTQISFSVNFTSPASLDEGSLIVYGLTHSTDALLTNSLCSVRLENMTQSTFLYGQTIYYIAKTRRPLPVNTELEALLELLKSGSSSGQAYFSMNTYANLAHLYKGIHGPETSEIFINNQTIAEFNIVHGNLFRGHEGIYRVTLVLPYWLEQGGSIFIHFPPEFVLTQDLESFENCKIIEGMKVRANVKRIAECSKTAPDTYVIRGYDTVEANTRITVHFGLLPNATGVNLKPTVKTFSSFGLPHSEINNMQGVRITNQRAPFFLRKSFGVRLDSLHPGTRHNLRMAFTLAQAITFQPNDNRRLLIDLDTELVVEPGTLIWGYYRKQSSNVWIVVSRGQLNGHQITFNIRNITTLDANEDYDFLITFEKGNDIGILMPETGRYDIGIQIIVNNNLQYISFIQLLVLPAPFGADVCIYNPLVKETSKLSITEVTLKFRSDLEATDEIWIKLRDQVPDPAITAAALLYPWEIEYPIELSFDDKTAGVSTTAVLHLESANDKGTIRIKLNSTIPIGTTFSVFLPNLLNPNRIMYARARISLMRLCRSDNRLHCEILFGEIRYRVVADYSTLVTPSTLTMTDSLVSLAPSQHLFAFNLNEDMNKFDYLLVKYPNPFLDFPESCSSSMGQCIAFPQNKFALIRLASPVGGNSLATLSLSLKNANYESVAPLTDDIVLEAIGMVRCRIIHEFTFPQPTLQPEQFTAFTQTVLNSRNFNGFVPKLLKGQWNTVEFQVDSFFDIFTELIVIDLPTPEVTAVSNSLCNATLNVPSNPQPYPEPMHCEFNGNQVRITPSTNFNRAYALSGGNVVTFYLKFRIRSNTQSTQAVFQWKGYNLDGTGLRKEGTSSIKIENVNIPREHSMDLMRIPDTASESYDFHLAIDAVTTESISIIEFELPDFFSSNITAQTNVNCRFVGVNINVFSCYVLPPNGNVNLKLVAIVNNYFGKLTVLRVSGAVPHVIQLPAQPQHEYIGHVTLLRAANDPLETLLANMNMILHPPCLNVVVSTFANAETQSIVSVAFDMGPGGMPPGFAANAGDSFTKIIIEFVQAEGYESVLGYNGLFDPIIDCVGINILPANSSGLHCQLVRGQLFSNPEIHISNFQAIPPNTNGISLLISGITTQSVNQKGAVRIFTKKFVNDVVNPSFISSLPVMFWPPPRISLSPTVVERGAFSLVKDGRKWNITINININISLSASDSIEITLPYNLYYQHSLPQAITSNYGGAVYVFEKVGVILLSGQALPTGPFQLKLDGVPIPPFTVIGEVEIQVRVIESNIVQNLHFFKQLVNSTAGTSIPAFSVNLANSNGGFCGNSINININLGYSLSSTGQIRISIPQPYLRIWNGTDGGCTPQPPFPPHRGCDILNNQIVLSTPQVAPPNQDINVRLDNICLPNSQINDRFYLFAQYNSSNNSIFSVVSLPAPPVTVTPIQQCQFTGSAQFPNAEEWSDYVFGVNCPSPIVARTQVRIRLPGDFTDSFGPRGFANDRRCSVLGVLAKQDYCNIIFNNFVWVLFDIEDAPASTSFQVVIHDVINPGPNVYRIFMNMRADNFVYGRAQSQASITLLPKRIDRSSPLLARSFAAVPPTASQISSTVLFTTRMADFNQVAQVVLKVDQDSNYNFENRPIVCRAHLFTDFLTLNLDSYYWRELNNQTETLTCIRSGRNIVIDVSNSLRSSTKHIAWVVDGLRNPAVNRVLPFHIFYIKSNGEVFWSGKLSVDTSNWVSVKPIRLELTTTTNNKQGAFSQMNFTMDPFGGFGGQSEVALHLSNNYLNNTNNPATFCIDDNDDNIDCIQEDLQYSIRNFNGFQNRNRFNYGLDNIINPSSPTCNPGAPSNHEQFHADVVNFRSRGLVFKTFRVLPGENNCLEYLRRNYTVTVNGPSLVYPGTTNVFTVTLEAGSPNFRVRINPSHNGITSQPRTVRFNSLFVIQKTFRLNLDLSVPQGSESLIFTTVDPDNTFNSIPPFLLTIGDIRNAPNTTIFVESFDTIENNNSPQYLFIYLRRMPPLDLVINIDSNGTAGVNFNPQFLNFNPQTKEGFISVRVPPSVLGNLTMRLTVTGPQGEYVPYVFSRSVITVPIINTNQGVRLDYTLVQKDNIGRNNATVTICFNKPAFAHFVLVPNTQTPPTINNVLTAGNGNPLYTASGKVRTIINQQTNTNCTQLYLHGLDANTRYSLYIVGDDGSVPTGRRRVNFKTRARSNAIVLHMFLNPNDDIEQIRLIMASILGVSPNRIIIVPINRRRMLENGKAQTDIILAPETGEDDESPQELAAKMQSRKAIEYFKQKVPSFDVGQGISTSEYTAAVPALGTNATVSSESYNSVSFSFNLTGQGEVYGVRVPQSAIDEFHNGSLTLTPLNVYNGVLPSNQTLPTSEYKATGSTSNTTNVVTVGFGDIEDGEANVYYFVLADKVNMNPPELSSEVTIINHSTKTNPYSVSVEL